MEKYFQDMDKQLRQCYKVANDARKKGFDPEEKVDIPLARNMAERVEGLISAVVPQIIGSGVSKRIQQLEQKYGALAWEVALIIADEVAKEKFCKFKDKREAMEIGIRTGFAYHTVGIVSAPLEGFIELKIKKRNDGKEYFAPAFAGPIRGAGGTAAAVCLLITDYVRSRFGYDVYDPTDAEINRYISELEDYHERVTNLQYKPSAEEIRFLMKHCPVEIEGDPTEKIEVSNYKDLPRVETNRIRGGVCLVTSMLALKAPKVWKEVRRFGKDLGIDWAFLEEFLKIQKKKKSRDSKSEAKLSPDFTYISDLVAGRPVLTYPLEPGGFRLRYGKTRASGYSAAAVNPTTMWVLEKYIATGTQLKVERPGKAATLTPCNTIEGPIVKLKNGNVIRLEKEADARSNVPQIQEVLFLGDFLVSYGDFFDRAHPLVPAGYCEEWYIQELEKATVDMFGNLDFDKLTEHTGLAKIDLTTFLKDPFLVRPTAETAIRLSKKLNIPLHPYYTYHWNIISLDQFKELMVWFEKAQIKKEEDKISKIILPYSDKKRTLELIGVPHTASSNEFIVIEKHDAQAIITSLGLPSDIAKVNEMKNITTLEAVNKLSDIKIRDKSGTFIGARMGRPEKSKMRRLTGSPQVLFPVGEEGGRLRCFQSALDVGHITSAFPFYTCTKCNEDTIYAICERCGKKTKQRYHCRFCGDLEKDNCEHGKGQKFKEREINIKHYFNNALELMGTKIHPDLIKGVRGTSSKDRNQEHIMKGILRATFDIYVNKDGTTRYDMTELPITHFKPNETGTDTKKLISLGYTHDIHGKPLETDDQLLELKPQDVILPRNTESTEESADSVLFRTSKFVDELLVRLYGAKRFYNLKEKKEVVGHLVIGLAPHISSGMVGRVIGFSQTQALLAHPLFHAAMRRDCDGDEACVILAMDALLNFSRKYLPDARGSRTMDAPLVLTAKLVPAEVDDMVHRFDMPWKYTLDFYEATQNYKMPWDVKVELLGASLGTPKQYEGIGFTHSTSSVNTGVVCSAYKTLPSMEEKLQGQMRIAEQLRAVDATDVARLVIEKHLLKDIKGNLRKFSTQRFRCVKCNEKFRRPPLTGICTKCSGRIIFTISEGSIIKYLEPAISLADKYDVSAYLKQSLELTKKRVEDVFGKEHEKQEGLGRWF
ncbi:MAG: DNA polymerase II large subunit [bacterium]|nr:DNA polymerase II large subunit [bacterium]